MGWLVATLLIEICLPDGVVRGESDYDTVLRHHAKVVNLGNAEVVTDLLTVDQILAGDLMAGVGDVVCLPIVNLEPWVFELILSVHGVAQLEVKPDVGALLEDHILNLVIVDGAEGLIISHIKVIEVFVLDNHVNQRLPFLLFQERGVLLVLTIGLRGPQVVVKAC